MAHRVLVADPLAEVGLGRLRAETGFELDVALGLEEPALCERVAASEALVVRSRTRVSQAVLEAGRCLRLVVRAGTGTDNIALAAATERGVVVANTPGANANAAAEHTLALMLALARHVPAADRSLKQGSFDKKRFTGVELRGKTLGVVGLGRIGSAVARLGAALGMRVIGHDPLIEAQAAVCPLVSLSELLAGADFVTLHTPLGVTTRHLLDAKGLAAMKRGARLVNCARGGLLDEQALVEALDAGRLSGAALDVFEEEPRPPRALVERDDVIATPHIGGQTTEASEAVALEAAELVIEALSGRGFRNVVNPQALARR